MVANTQTLDRIFSEASRLSPEYRLRLVQRIMQTLVSSSPLQEPQPLRFGEFGGDEEAMSTLEDFAIAEWRPTNDFLFWACNNRFSGLDGKVATTNLFLDGR